MKNEVKYGFFLSIAQDGGANPVVTVVSQVFERWRRETRRESLPEGKAMPERKTKPDPKKKSATNSDPKSRSVKKQKTTAVVLDAKKVDQLLSTAATAYAMNSVLTVKTAKDAGFWSNIKRFYVDQTPRSMTSTQVDIKLYRQRRKMAMKIYSDQFFKKLEQGPKEVLEYLETKHKEIRQNRLSISSKTKLANAVNDDVIRQLNLSINTTYAVQTAMGALFVVVSGAGLTFKVALGAGLAYSVTCSAIKSVADGKAADIVALAVLPGSAVSIAGGTTSEAALKACGKEISDEFLSKCIDKHQAAKQRLESIENSRLRHVREGALKRAKANVAKTGRVLRNVRVARFATKGVSSAIGLLFMVPELETAIKFDYAQQQEKHPSKRRKDLIGHAKQLVGAK